MDSRNRDHIISEAYTSYSQIVLGYFHKRLFRVADAEDLTQDVFVKLMEFESMLRPETLSSLIFTIAKNLLVDTNRRFYKRIEVEKNVVQSYQYELNTVEEDVNYFQLKFLESEAVNKLTLQKRKIYMMFVHGNYSYKEIAQALDLSPRTVEKHLLIGRSRVREQLLSCV